MLPSPTHVLNVYRQAGRTETPPHAAALFPRDKIFVAVLSVAVKIHPEVVWMSNAPGLGTKNAKKLIERTRKPNTTKIAFEIGVPRQSQEIM